jgi:hypothetical protein
MSAALAAAANLVRNGKFENHRRPGKKSTSLTT